MYRFSAVVRTCCALLMAGLLLVACGGNDQASLSTLEISPATPTLALGTSQQLAVTAIFSDGSKRNVSSEVSWRTLQPTVATVGNSAADHGRLHAVSVGHTTVVARYGEWSAEARVQVTAAVATALTIAPATLSMPKGTQHAFVATAAFSDNTSQDVTADATWLSSAPAVVAVDAQGVAKALSLGVAELGARYAGFDAAVTVTVTDAVLDRVELSPAAPTLAKGSQLPLVATAVFSDGSNRDVSADAVWSSAAPEIATVSDSEADKGRLSGVAIGTTTVSASYMARTATVDVTVTAAVLSRLEVTPAQVSIAKGLTQQFVATAIFSDMTRQDVTSSATWSSANVNAVTISNADDTSGLAKALEVVTTTISASYQGQQGEAALTVTPAVAIRVEVTPPQPSIPLGATQQLTATGVYSDGSVKNITAAVSWSSSDIGIVAIGNADGSKGLAVASAAGTATLSAEINGVSGSAVATVTSAVLRAIQVTPANARVAVNFERRLTATGLYTDSTTRDLSADVTWSSSDNSIATISNVAGSKGNVAGVATGVVSLSAQQGAISGAVLLTVSDATLTSLQLSPASTTLPMGSDQQMTAIGTFSDNTTQNLSAQVVWSSSNTAVATVANTAGAHGLVSGLAVGGPVTISATRAAISGDASVTVSDAVLESMVLAPSTASVPKGLEQQFSATGFYTDGSSKDLTKTVTWASSSDATASISNAAATAGLATALAVGSTTISASSGTLQVEATLEVSNAVLAEMHVTPATASVAKGVVQLFKATGTYSDGSVRDISQEVLWASSDEAIATVSNDAESHGRVTTLSIGLVDITANTDTLSHSAQLQVTDAALQTLELTPAAPSVPAGTSIGLRATGTYSDGSTQDLTQAVTWSSANAAVAEVSNGVESAGLVFGKAAGTSVIQASVPDTTIVGKTTVTVSAALLQAIVISPASESLPNGFGRYYSAQGQFSDGVDRDISAQVSWRAIDPAIVSVDDSAARKGFVRALQAGHTTVVATLNGITGTTPVTVKNVALQALAITPEDATIKSAESLQFNAMGSFADGSMLDLTTQVLWTSSNAGVATISNADGSHGRASAGNAIGSSTIGAAHGSIKQTTTLQRTGP